MDKKTDKKREFACSLRTEPGLALKGCWLPHPGLVHFSSSPPPHLSFTNSPLYHSPLPLNPDSSWSPPEHSCHLVHPPLQGPFLFVLWPPTLSHSGVDAATSSPPALSWLPPSPPYNCRHSARAGMSNRSCFPDPAGSRTRS